MIATTLNLQRLSTKANTSNARCKERSTSICHFLLWVFLVFFSEKYSCWSTTAFHGKVVFSFQGRLTYKRFVDKRNNWYELYTVHKLQHHDSQNSLRHQDEIDGDCFVSQNKTQANCHRGCASQGRETPYRIPFHFSDMLWITTVVIVEKRERGIVIPKIHRSNR